VPFGESVKEADGAGAVDVLPVGISEGKVADPVDKRDSAPVEVDDAGRVATEPQDQHASSVIVSAERKTTYEPRTRKSVPTPSSPAP
jgi:hypothetical protein